MIRPWSKKSVVKPWLEDDKSKRRKQIYKKVYNTRDWQKLRDSHKSKEPLCRHCLERGIITEATVVDHIIEINDGGKEWDDDNLQSLCASCHQRKTNKYKNKLNKQKGGI